MLILSGTASDSVSISEGALVSIVISVLGFIGVLVTLLHKNMINKIDRSAADTQAGFNSIHVDIKPIAISIALHENEIKRLAGEIKEHGIRINELEHQIDTKVDKHDT